MPELPEVETVRLALQPTLEGKSLLDIQLNRPDLRFPLPFNMASELCQQPVIAVRRRAKYLLVDFEHGLTLIWHLGMSGRVIIEDLGAPFLQSSPHDHVILTTCHNHRITYRDPRRFGFLLLAPTNTLENINPFNTLGPEPLENIKIILPTFHERLQRRNIPIKNALLDQKIIAGVGNIYASEALWQAKISPLRAANSLTRKEMERLLVELQDVLKRAIAAGGSTLRDHARPNGEIGYFQHSFKVYDREGKLCAHCHSNELIRTVQSGRATYYCGYCQH